MELGEFGFREGWRWAILFPLQVLIASRWDWPCGGVIFEELRVVSQKGEGGTSIFLRCYLFGVFGSSEGYQSALERLDLNCFAQSSTPGPLSRPDVSPQLVELPGFPQPSCARGRQFWVES